MGQRSAPYPTEFRQKIVELYRSGRSVAELCEEFEPCEQTVYRWIRQADIDAGERDDGPTSDEKKEVSELKRELRRVRQERDILAKAAAWYARETTDIPDGSSSS